MGKIVSIKLNQAQIALEDCRVRLSVKYKGVYCSEIKIWKLPESGNLLNLLKIKKTYWAAYGDSAKFLQGWLYQDDLMKILASKIEKCSNESDLKALCLDLNRIIGKKNHDL